MKKTSSKFHFIIDFGEDLTCEEAKQHLETPLKNRFLFPSLIVEDIGIATDRVLQVYLPQKDFKMLWERAEAEGDYLASVARKIIQKSLSEWEKGVR